MRLSILFVPAAAAALAAVTQSAPYTFVVRANTDTLAVERITRTANTVTGELRLGQEGAKVRYVAHLRPDGSSESVEVFDDAPNFFTGILTFSAAAAAAEQEKAATTGTRVAPAPGNALPVIGTSIGLIEQIIRAKLPPKVGDSVEVRVINIRNRNPGRITITRTSRDSAHVDCEGCMRQRQNEFLLIALAKDGGIAGASRPEQHWVVTREK